MTTVAVRLSSKEMEYLGEIAHTNKIHKGETSELSIGKALKELIKWCRLNQIDINEKKENLSDELHKMIEQIHIAVPNLMYLARLQTLLSSDGISDEKIIRSRQQTVDYLNNVCGDFQNVQYNQVRFSINDIGLKSTPIDKEKSLWKQR